MGPETPGASFSNPYIYLCTQSHSSKFFSKWPDIVQTFHQTVSVCVRLCAPEKSQLPQTLLRRRHRSHHHRCHVNLDARTAAIHQSRWPMPIDLGTMTTLCLLDSKTVEPIGYKVLVGSEKLYTTMKHNWLITQVRMRALNLFASYDHLKLHAFPK